jgi:hypothetical protein
VDWTSCFASFRDTQHPVSAQQLGPHLWDKLRVGGKKGRKKTEL